VTSGGDFTSSNGQGISIPSLLPSALGQVAAGIATGISDAGVPDPIQVRRRWAVVLAINTDSTVDIDLGGVTVPHVSYDASYHPALDEVVQVNVVDTDITVIGPTANSTYVSYIRRTGTIVAVNRSSTAPGNPTSVNVTLSDAQVPLTVLNVPFVSEYFPTVGDDVMLGQGTNTSVYLVLGAVSRPWRRPTGDIEPSLMSVPKTNTLILNGQLVSRTTYAALWAWVQLNGLVTTGMFTTGNGTTTFGLPDFRGRVPIGVGTLGADTYALGATGGSASLTISAAQMPSHTHTVADHGTHDHTISVTADGAHGHSASSAGAGQHFHANNFTSGAGGGHGGHFPTSNPNLLAVIDTTGSGYGIAPWNGPGASVGNHSHAIQGDTSTELSHSHSVSVGTSATHTHAADVGLGGGATHSVGSTGSGTAIDARQPYLAINWIVWT
jgi:microcystin-dependent protein